MIDPANTIAVAVFVSPLQAPWMGSNFHLRIQAERQGL